MLRNAAALLAPALLAALAACSTPPQVEGGGALAECRAHFLALDQATNGDGVRDAGAYRVPGFPYLRSNRFLASFRTGLDEARFEVWVRHLQQFGLESRAAELRNLGGEDVERELRHLQRCGAAWAAQDLADPARRQALRERVEVPDDYSVLRRVLGVYALTAPILKLGVYAVHREIKEDFGSALDDTVPLALWQPPAADAATPAQVAHWLKTVDALGFPQLDDAQWWAMAAAHAPAWWVETGGDFDLPGAPVLRNGSPGLDLSQPVTYFQRAYTRFAGRALPQLVYTVWFSQRPAQGALDPYAGTLDGLVWRVTLDTDGTPLLYDTIHPCGCYHLVFPAKPLARRPHDDFWQEPVLFPQEPMPAGRPALRVQSGTHYVRRVADLEQAEAAAAREYRLADYRELLSLPDGPGEATRSLFCADGLVCGTERLERYWLWPSGVKSPGAMRQWGRHATAFVGRRHFDEPFLLERLFVSR